MCVLASFVASLAPMIWSVLVVMLGRAPDADATSRSLVRREEKKMMEADVQGDYQAMSVAVNKRMLWPSRRKIINKSRQRSMMR